MIGVSSGTKTSRGVRAVSWKRRFDSVASGPSTPTRARRRGKVAVAVAADMCVLPSGGAGEAIAGEPQVDVVEGWLSRADRAGEPELADCRDRVCGRALVQRDGQRGADRERVVTREASPSQRFERL